MESSFKVQVTLNSKYRGLVVRGRSVHEQIQRSEFLERRGAGDTNLDLWLDGNIYPIDPCSFKRPSFNNVKSLLEFVGDGRNGLLGYVSNLQSTCEISDASTLDRQRLQLEIEKLRQVAKTSEKNEEQLLALTGELQTLQDENSVLKNASAIASNLTAAQRDEISSLLKDIDESVQSEIELESEIEALKKKEASEQELLVASHKMELEKVKSNYDKSRRTLAKLQRKWNHLCQTPYGPRQQVRVRKDIASLSQTGGHAKALRRLARSVIAPATVKRIQSENATHGKKQRLHGPVETQVQSGKVLASIFSKTEVRSMIETPVFESVGVAITNHNLEKIGKGMGKHEILGITDRNNITQDGYNALFQGFAESAKTICHGIRISCLMPKPYHVSLLRQELNSKFKDFVGEYYSINNEVLISPSPKSKKKELVKLKLNEFNSLFVDVEQVQRTMVNLYRITPEETGENPLIFVLKMDEAEIVHDQKFERVSITLMNRALNPNINIRGQEYFSVHSEREIWPVGCFQVEKESYDILSWIFNQTKLPELISAQGRGQMLDVSGVGSFKIEWHLSANMKTIKCLYGLSHGACAQMSCMYCCQKSTKTKVGTIKQAEAAFAKKTSTWTGGLFSNKIESKPLTGNAILERWKPIFAIPLDRVHMCMLHAFNRIIEKIVHLHFQFIWTIRDKTLQKEAIEEMQKVLSSTGAHGGNVKIFKDEKLSGQKNNIPCKPSFNGVHAARLFKKSLLDGGSEVLYFDLISAEKNFLDNGEGKRQKLEVWNGLAKLRPYFTALMLTDELKSSFKEKIEEWGRAYLAAFGEMHVTHYIHGIVKHAPWFVNRYGSLAIWSCQGMEYSHYAVKAAYQRHTQHSSGRAKKSPLVQTYQHWYRIIQHRFRDQEKHDKEVAFQESEEGIALEAVILKRREVSIASSANAHWLLWREKCNREGSKFVPLVDTNDIENEYHEVPDMSSEIRDL